MEDPALIGAAVRRAVRVGKSNAPPWRTWSSARIEAEGPSEDR
ncbi:MAG TPA: hypothetical protein VJT32_13825 [bacterium]|nr:hypothetical protein [bacterium]